MLQFGTISSWEARSMNKKQSGHTAALFVVVIGGLLVVVTVQAILGLLSGNFAGDNNYYGQPVGPVLQLIGAIACLIFIGLYARRRGHRAPDQQHRKKEREPKWKGQPPYKFPWDQTILLV